MNEHHHPEGEACTCPIGVVRETDARPRVVIVGAGFAGLTAARALEHAPVRVTLVDRRNHHLFQPLLYQVATAGLSPSQIASPIRTIVRHQPNVDVVLGEVTGVDTEAREVITARHRIAYDYLVLATGARHSYFGHDAWEEFAPGLKSLEETEQRKRLLLALERAELESDEAERRRLLTFVVIGAGPTGVEMAGAIAELTRKALVRDFRNIDPQCARIVLVEAGPRVLGAFAEPLSEAARKSLECLGVEVRTGTAVTAIDADGISLGSERIESRCVIWAAGVMSSPVATWLGAKADRAGRLEVGGDLRVPGFDNIFVIGDCANVPGKDGKPLPGLAPVAKQEGAHVAALIRRDIAGAAARAPFVYKDFGTMATIGRKSAIADFGKVRLKGFLGWLVWSLAHIYFLIGFRNRIAVAFDWLWSYLTFERGARLITGPIEEAKAGESEEAAPHAPLRAVS